jgi:Na+-translocating ferredoxin:NAD+ oxidoreductase subunit E
MHETALATPPTAGTPARPNPFVDAWNQNPTFVKILGMCPTLAVTNSVSNALAMGLCTTFVLVVSNALISAVRRLIPKQIRIAAYIAIIATAVTVVDYVLKAVSISVYKALGAFVALIVVNCIILERAESYAGKNEIGGSILDGLGSGLGFSVGLLCLGSVREILGAGTFLGFSLFGPNFEPWVLFLLPPGGFITLAFWLMVITMWKARKQSKKQEEAHS